MSKQTQAIDLTCARRKCHRQATFGVYGWSGADTDVNLNRPLGAYCGGHKPDFAKGYKRGVYLRNVRLNLNLITEH